MRAVAMTSILLALIAVVGLAGGGQEADPEPNVDQEIEEDVEQALVRDARVEADQITVAVEAGIVTLTGSVDSIREESAAMEVARNVLGVIDVIDEMSVVADAEAASERILESNVRQALRTNTAVDAAGIIVEADGARVMLSGTVDSLYERERAGSIAADVTGVVTVINELEVSPETARADSAIRRDVQGALIRNSLVDKDDITVLVQDGQVTLTGTVASWVEEQEALDAAQFTAGVTSVVNQLEISPSPLDDVTTRSIREQVREQLQWDVRVDDSNISVSVSDGVVTLSGTVPSAAAESAALASAWAVTGVRDVIDRLEVAAAPVDEQTGLAQIVENSIRVDPDVAVEDLEVVEDNGVIELYGNVDEAWMAREAESTAENTIGVEAVENNLVVVPPQERTDVEIRLDIVSSLQADMRVDASGVQVIVDDGVVTLDGTVASWNAWETAYAAALQTEGVVRVNAELDVQN